MARKSSVSVWAQVVHVWGERSCSPPWDKLTLESDPFPRPAGRISLLLLSAFFSLGVESFGLDARSPLHCPFLTFSSLLQGDRDVIWTTALPFKTESCIGIEKELLSSGSLPRGPRGPKPGARNLTQLLEPPPAASQGVCCRKMESVVEVGLEPGHFGMGGRRPRQHLDLEAEHLPLDGDFQAWPAAFMAGF